MSSDAMASRPAPNANKISMSLALQLAFAQLMRGGDPLLSGLINAHIVSVPGPMKHAA